MKVFLALMGALATYAFAAAALADWANVGSIYLGFTPTALLVLVAVATILAGVLMLIAIRGASDIGAMLRYPIYLAGIVVSALGVCAAPFGAMMVIGALAAFAQNQFDPMLVFLAVANLALFIPVASTVMND